MTSRKLMFSGTYFGKWPYPNKVALVSLLSSQISRLWLNASNWHSLPAFLVSSLGSHWLCFEMLMLWNLKCLVILRFWLNKQVASKLWHNGHYHSPLQSKHIISFSLKCWNRRCCFRSFTDLIYGLILNVAWA